MRCAACGVRCAVCGVRCEVCGVRRAVAADYSATRPHNLRAANTISVIFNPTL